MSTHYNVAETAISDSGTKAIDRARSRVDRSRHSDLRYLHGKLLERANSTVGKAIAEWNADSSSNTQVVALERALNQMVVDALVIIGVLASRHYVRLLELGGEELDSGETT